MARSRGHLAQPWRRIVRSIVPDDVGVVVWHLAAGSPRVAEVQRCGFGARLLLLLLHVVEGEWPAAAAQELRWRRAVVEIRCSSIAVGFV